MDISAASLLAGLALGLLAGVGVGWALARSWQREHQQLLATDLDQRQRAVEHLVAPLQASLQQVEQHLAHSERLREQAHGELRAQVNQMGQTSDALRNETASLVTALRAPQVRGRWGEMQLRRVVELAGLVEHCDFDEQMTVSTDDGPLRPDLVVHLAGDRHLVVDAKVPFAGYLDAVTSDDPTVRDERMRAHSRHLRTHVDDLASKAYWRHVGDSPELVVLFVPAETFLTAALEQDPTLLEHAFARNVVIATPATLIALLRTVALGWRQEALAENAQQVHRVGRDLYARLSTFAGHLGRVGGALDSAVTAYNQAVGSWESRVTVSARRLDALQVGDGRLTEEPAVREIVPTVRTLRDTAVADTG
ncbi:MAG: DNA recombination protein RmuC [Actinomycetes bacterium]